MTPEEEAAKNRGQVTPLGPGVVDRSAFNYGGDPAAAGRESGALAVEAANAQGRQGEHIDTAQTDADRALSGGTRTQAMGMADLVRARAMGRTPSIAGMRADQDMGRAIADQSSIGASARGPAAMALAQQQAANNSAAAVSNISNAAQINTAQERQQAEQSAYSMYAGQRAGDQSQQGMDAQQAQAQAGINAAQRAANDAYTTNTRQQGIGIQTTQLGADMNRDAQEQAGHFNAAAAQANKNRDDDANLLGYVSAGAQTAAAVAPMVASDERTKVPVSWGAGGAAPTDTGYGRSSQDVQSGYDTNSVSMARMVANRALDEHAMRSARDASAAATSPAGIAGGPMAVDMNPGARWDREDLGLIDAKKRHGADLTDRESANEASLRHRQGAEGLKATTDKAADKHEEAKKALSTGEQVGAAGAGALSGIGKVLGNMSAARRSEAWRPTTAPQYQMPVVQGPMVTTSDDHAKLALAQREAFSAGLAHANEARDTGKFGDVPAYVKDGPNFHDPDQVRRSSVVKRQPFGEKGNEHKAVSSVDRGDASAQRASNDVGDKNLGRADMLEAGGGVGVTAAGILRAREAKYQADHKPQAPEPKRREPVAFSRGASTVDTALSPGEEADFAKWKAHYAPNDSGGDYDLRGAYRAGIKPDPKNGHWPDTYKKPNHETFSDESQYAKQGKPGHWDGDNFTPYHPPAAMSSVQRAEPPPQGVFSRASAAIRSAPDAISDTLSRAYPDQSDGPISMSDERSKERMDVGTLGKEMPHDAMADAARSMRGVPYKYKSQFAEQEGQAPGEVNVGPVAQEMEKSPVAATAVKQDPRTGMRGIDVPKYTKVLGAIAADQQDEIDDLHKQLSFMARRMGGRR